MEGKVVLITGASSGIGEGCALEFANEKSLLALTGRNMDALLNVKQRCIENGLTDNQILLIKADMAVDSEIKRIIELTIEKFGRLDALLNIAGILVYGSLEDITMEKFDEQMNINVRGPVFLTKLSVPYLKASKGVIVNVSSICGLRSFPGVIAYNMSKAALNSLTECLALELASSGVRVNAVNPGIIKTNIHTRAGYDIETYEKFMEKSKSIHALGRTGTVEEVVKAILFLASDKSSFTTGHLLPVDGGMGIMTPR